MTESRTQPERAAPQTPAAGSTGRDRAGERARAVVLVGGPLVVLMALVSVAAAVPLAGEDIVLHRGLDGQPTRIGPAGELLVLFPVFGLMTFGLMLVAAYAADTRRDGRPPPSPGAMAAISAAVLGVFAAVHAIAVADAVGLVEGVGAWTLGVLGLALVGTGVAYLAPPTAGAALTSINLALPVSPERQRRVGRVAGCTFLAVGLGSVAAAPTGRTGLTLAVLVGSLALIPAVLVLVTVRERTAERLGR